MIECRTMASAERYDAFALMERFRTDTAALGEALTLFIDRPDYGFIWLAYLDDHPAACASVSLGIDTGSGRPGRDGARSVRRSGTAPPRNRLGTVAHAARAAQHLEVARIEARAAQIRRNGRFSMRAATGRAR